MTPISSKAQQIADAASERYHRHRRRRMVTITAGRIALVAGGLVAWEAASGVLLDPYFVSSPVSIADAFTELVTSGRFVDHVGLTVQEALIGYCFGAVLATIAAAVLGALPRTYATVEPFMLALYATPAVAIAPLIIVWFGLGITPKVILAAYFVFLHVFMNGVSGVRSVPQPMIAVVRVMGANRFQLYTKVVLRAAGPHLLNGYRVAVPSAIIGAMVGEFISSQRGIGYLIADYASQFDTAGAFAALLILAVLVMTMAGLLNVGSRMAGERRQP